MHSGTILHTCITGEDASPLAVWEKSVAEFSPIFCRVNRVWGVAGYMVTWCSSYTNSWNEKVVP